MSGTTPRDALQPMLVILLGFVALALDFSARAAVGLMMPIWKGELGWPRSFIYPQYAWIWWSSFALAVFAGLMFLAICDRKPPMILAAGGVYGA
jgi:hypothetical protein